MKKWLYDVSVIIPAKNADKFLPEVFEGLLQQTSSENDIRVEICVADDGSTDRTADVANEYRTKFEEKSIGFKLCSVSRPGGVGHAKSCAINISSGQFLCFNDADDVSDPERIFKQYRLAKSLINTDHDFVFLGGNFHRTPRNSTTRYTNWANRLKSHEITKQVYTSHGPTLIAPTWFISRTLYDFVGGFRVDVPTAFPEDLDFFYKCLDVENCVFDKVTEDIVSYRYHSDCASFSVKEETIFHIRLQRLKREYLQKWDKFSIWSVGKQGKRFFKSLTEEEKGKVSMFCDIDISKVNRGMHEEFDEKCRKVTHRVPIVHINDAKPPLVVCVKLDLTNGDLESIIAKNNWEEHIDIVYFG